MKVLIAVLTNKNPEALHRCLLGIDQSQSPRLDDVELEKVCIVNTTDKNFYRFAMGTCTARKWPMEITSSNGMPGRGKNSVLDYFLKSDCDYLIHVDGDDYLGYTAISDLINFLIDNQSDVVGLHNTHTLYKGNIRTFTNLDSHLLQQIYNSNTTHWNEETFDKFGRIFHEVRTNFDLTSDVFDFVRIVCYSKKGAQLSRFDETLMGMEDLLLSLQLKEKAKKKELNFHIADFDDKQIYIYDINNLDQGAASSFGRLEDVNSKCQYVLDKIGKLDLVNHTVEKIKM